MREAKMPSIVGYIEELDKEGRATSGRNKKYSVKINDGGSLGSRYFGAFQKELVANLEEGDFVNVMYNETPNRNNADYPYLNIDAMTKVTETEYNAAPSEPVETARDRAKTVATPSNGAGPSKSQAYKMPDSPAVQLSFQCQHATEAAIKYADMVGGKTLPEVMDYVDYIVHRWNATILNLKDNLDDEDYLQESILTSDVGVEVES
jgi:hypothetical protein